MSKAQGPSETEKPVPEPGKAESGLGSPEPALEQLQWRWQPPTLAEG